MSKEEKLDDFESNDFDENDEYHEDDLPDLVIDAHNQSRLEQFEQRSYFLFNGNLIWILFSRIDQLQKVALI